MRFRPALRARPHSPATAHLRTGAPVRSTPANRTPPSHPSACVRCAGSSAQSLRRPDFSPASEILRSAPAVAPARSQKTTPAVPLRAHREASSLAHLNPLISRSAVTVHHLKFLRQAQQTLRVAYKQIATGI